jgi:hypothetical protein
MLPWAHQGYDFSAIPGAECPLVSAPLKTTIAITVGQIILFNDILRLIFADSSLTACLHSIRLCDMFAISTFEEAVHTNV